MKKFNFSVIFSTLLMTGFIPYAPGTAGSIIAMIVYFILPSEWFQTSPAIFILIPVYFIILLITIPILTQAEKILGKDDRRIVLDEFMGFFLAVLFLPRSIMIIFLAFILFRVYDIFKPVPVNLLQKLPGGWGILADDLMAGIYSNVSCRVMLLLVPVCK